MLTVIVSPLLDRLLALSELSVVFVINESEVARTISREESGARKRDQHHRTTHYFRRSYILVDFALTIFIVRSRCRSLTIVDVVVFSLSLSVVFEKTLGSGLTPSHFVPGLPSRYCMGQSSYRQKCRAREID